MPNVRTSKIRSTAQAGTSGGLTRSGEPLITRSDRSVSHEREWWRSVGVETGRLAVSRRVHRVAPRGQEARQRRVVAGAEPGGQARDGIVGADPLGSAGQSGVAH